MEVREIMMRRALAEAETSGEDVPVGCVIVKDGRVISQAHNQRIAANDPSAHAEIVAMRDAARALGSWRLDGVELFVTLEPCPMCAEAIIQARVGRVVFGAYDFIYGATGSAFNLFTPGRSFPLPEVVGGVLQEDCAQILKNFFQARRREKGAV